MSMNVYRTAICTAALTLAALPAVTATAASADIKLSGASAVVTQTSDTEWQLEKVGALNGNVASWVIGATEQQSVPGLLRVSGQMTVTNTGTGPATIGNIVVNLQRKVGTKFVTAASDIANATDGDDATEALIHKAASAEGLGKFTESQASGELHFMDATNNTIFSLVPQVVIPAGETRTLLFQGSFDNNILQIAAGVTIRTEVIVSFGNATANGKSTANVDINGNGSIDADEARVRSVPTRLTSTVPAQVPGNATVTLTDTLADISTTGTVSFSNVAFNLGTTSGTVTATVSGGADGGTITNCAHLTSASSTVTSSNFTFPLIDGINEEACGTISIGATTCTPGTQGCGWKAGDVLTLSQTGWDASTTLSTYFATLYGANLGVEVGITGSAGYSMKFSSPTRVRDYLPAGGTVGALNADLLNPTTTPSGNFGGEVLALQLNVDYAANGYLGGTSGLALGDLRVCGLSTAALNGKTVDEVRAIANELLGGNVSTGYSIADVSLLAAEINGAFSPTGASTFAQQNLFSVACN